MKSELKKVKEMLEGLKKFWGKDYTKKLNFLLKQNPNYFKVNDKGELGDFISTVIWYKEISKLKGEDKRLVLGDGLAKPSDVRDAVLKQMDERLWKSYNKAKEEHYKEGARYYDEDGDECDFDQGYTQALNDSGYAGVEESLKIKAFFESLNDKNVLMPFIDDGHYLDGHRHYFFSNAKLKYIYFNIFNKQFGITEQDQFNLFIEENGYYYSFEELLCDIEDLYVPNNFRIFDNIKIDELYLGAYARNNREQIENFNGGLDEMIDLFEDDEFFSEKVEVLKNLKIKN